MMFFFGFIVVIGQGFSPLRNSSTAEPQKSAVYILGS